MEIAINELAKLCICENVVKGIKPAPLAAVGSKYPFIQTYSMSILDNKILAICLGTTGQFPHNLAAKPVKGRVLAEVLAINQSIIICSACPELSSRKC